MVFLPGLAATSRLWAATAKAMAHEHRVVLLDLPGFGSTPAPMDGMTVKNLAGEVATTLRDADLGEVIIVAHSLGSMIALEIAANNAQVRALVLVSGATSSLFRLYHEPLEVLRSSPRVVLHYLLLLCAAGMPFAASVLPPVLARFAWLRRVALRPFVGNPDVLSYEDISILVSGFGTWNAWRLARWGGQFDLERLSSQLTTLPIYAASGTCDGLSSADDRRYYESLVVHPDRLTVWDAVGHAPMIENREAVLLWLRQTVQKCSGVPQP